MVMDVSSKKIDQIPSLQSSENSVPPDSECGLHRQDGVSQSVALLSLLMLRAPGFLLGKNK
jgi:hypothetical protein